MGIVNDFQLASKMSRHIDASPSARLPAAGASITVQVEALSAVDTSAARAMTALEELQSRLSKECGVARGKNQSGDKDKHPVRETQKQ